MSVLESMRSGTDSTFMQVVLAAVVVSFVFWYATPQGNTGAVIVTVNGHEIMDTEFYRQVRQQEQAQEGQLGRVLTESEQARLRQQVRDEMISSTVLLQEAEKLGLEVSDIEVARRINAITAFHGEDGKFDPRIYENTRRRLGYTESDFEDRMRSDLLRVKFQTLVYNASWVSDDVLREAYLDQNTTIDVEYVRIRPAVFQPAVEVDESILATWLEVNGERVRQTYEADFQRLYDLPEKVSLKVIRFKVLEDGLDAVALTERLEVIKAELDAGADFGALARRWSEDPSAAKGGDLGELSTTDLTPSLADAVGELEPGQVSGVVAGSGDVRLLKLVGRVPARQVPYEEVRDEIAERLLREEKAPTLAAAFAERLLEAWTAAPGAAPAAMLAEHGLTSDFTGPRSVTDGPALGPPEEMLSQATRSEVGGVLPQVYTSGSTLYVGRLATRDEADEADFEDNKDTLRNQVLGARRGEFLNAYLDDVVAKAKIE